ncbi:maleylpyruvate isomerase N-terminal domain-containing protein [Streptomyces sp. DH24]|uniref:maleylpyruvate isomerase N-terminal domain-containing protein n=1 Tax=Streptomyces sp. DH24 TaxID=3040123 RepID=UPI0024435585|nr:maleylpyruvate isomerase N-terminal domain-containing protein [Streptomyces sp. DH24]MDG9718348.1 maleylpyruvate isomerase N-terminal domain-containing protein [Streptomyces sp. DH24]
METARFLEVLDAEGILLAAAAERAGTDAGVPACPGWRMRDLLRHTGAVHRWAAAFVAEEHMSPRPIGDGPELDGAELIAWYRDSHRGLVETLAAAPPDVRAWTFHPAPSPGPLAFWTRRQAHETTVHRFDAEGAAGAEGTEDTADPEGTAESAARAEGAAATNAAPVGTARIDTAPIGTEFAVDGIDELLRGFHARPRSRVRTDEPRVLRVRATDTDAVWTVRLSPQPPVATPDDSADADCELAGPADQLYLALWNRRPVPNVSGDRSLAALWQERSAIV